MKKILAALVVLVTIGTGSYSYAASAEKAFARVEKSGTIRCGYFTWQPAFMKDPNTGTLSGINYDFMDKVGHFLGLKIEWAEEVGIGSVTEALGAGRIDVMCASMWPDPAKMFHTEYTLPTYFSAVYAIVRGSDKRFDGNLNSINKPEVKVCGIEGDITANASRAAFPQANFVGLPPTADGSQLILSVVSNKCDVMLGDAPLLIDYSKTAPGKIRKVAGVDPVHVFGEHLLVNKGEHHLKMMLDTAITTLVNSGEMDKVLDGYEGVYGAPEKAFKPLR
ncbi:MAG: transporter substrate-binding domain-containing protein [Alphaproteobacteria bacterium]|nr:transporter substrate-binding domain-containing protein [Alphaproteobacteria bacterium]